MALICKSGGKECTGCGDCGYVEPCYCPVCGEECDYIYKYSNYDEILGCENCIERKRADEIIFDD